VGDARMPSKPQPADRDPEDVRAAAWLLAAILGAPVTSYTEEPRDGKASGPYEHTWYADVLDAND
jgi:hypothetical protein